MSANKKTSQRRKKQRDTNFSLKVDTSYGKGQLDYAHKQVPVARGLRTVAGAPNVNGNKAFVVKHSEYLIDIDGTVNFSLLSLPIQPGVDASFPWLSTVALNFEEWRIKSLRYRLESQAPTTAQGTMMLAIDYDPADGAPISKIQLMTKAGATRCSVWDAASCAANSARRAFSKLFVRPGNLAANLDIKTYDYGNVVVAVEGCSTTAAIAELYVDYEIEFFTPESSGNQEIAVACYDAFLSGTATAPFTTVSNATGGLPITFLVNNSFRINRVGTYLLTWIVTGTGLTNNTNPVYTGLPGNALDTAYSQWNSLGVISGGSLTAGTTAVFASMIEIGAAGDGLQVSLGPLGTTVTGGHITFTPIAISSKDPKPIAPGVQMMLRNGQFRRISAEPETSSEYEDERTVCGVRECWCSSLAESRKHDLFQHGHRP